MHLIRVELHRTKDYNPLHVALEEHDILRIVRSSTNKLYYLPTGTYVASNSSRAQVYQTVHAVVHALGHHDAWIVVTDATALTFDLDEAKEAA